MHLRKSFLLMLLVVFSVSTLFVPTTFSVVKAAATVYTAPPTELYTSIGQPQAIGEISGSSRAFEIVGDSTVIHLRDAYNNVNARLDFNPAKNFSGQEIIEMTLRADVLTGSVAT
ncbi:MAG TPA: hypothetical protein VJH75_01705, partial [Patescibacteria group bacterium]|nr:hypothetical protein [Patescibacteria group bacterium]